MGLIDDIYLAILGVYRAIVPQAQPPSGQQPQPGAGAMVGAKPPPPTAEESIISDSMHGILEMVPINVDMGVRLTADANAPGRMQEIQKSLEMQGRMRPGDVLSRTKQGTLAIIDVKERRIRELVYDEPEPPPLPPPPPPGGTVDYYAGFDSTGKDNGIEARANSFRGRESEWSTLARKYMQDAFKISPNIANEESISTLAFGSAMIYRNSKPYSPPGISFQQFLTSAGFFSKNEAQ